MTPLDHIVIVGHGAPAFVSALTLSRALQGVGGGRITVVETPTDPHALAQTDAGLAPFRAFQALLGFTEADAAQFAQAAPYLGTLRSGWTRGGGDYVQSLGETGATLNNVAFQHYLTWERLNGRPAAFEVYSLAAQAARAGKFQLPEQDSRSILSTYTYGLNVSLGGYAQACAVAAQSRGVRLARAAGFEVTLTAEGRIAALKLASGEVIAGDFYIDATGADAFLMRRVLGANFEAAPFLTASCMTSVRIEGATAQPLNGCDRVAGGYLTTTGLRAARDLSLIYDPAEIDESAAAQSLSGAAGPAGLTHRRFRQGRLTQAWRGNCLAVGEAAGVLEPLAGSSLHRLQAELTRLIGLFPDRRMWPVLSEHYNRLTAQAFDRQRDFAIAAYALADAIAPERLPNSVALKIEQFRSAGRVVMFDEESQNEAQWLNLFQGMGLAPERYHPLVSAMEPGRIRAHLTALRTRIAHTVLAMPPFKTSVLDGLFVGAPA